MNIEQVLFILTGVFLVLFVCTSVFESHSRGKFSDTCEKLMYCWLACGFFCGFTSLLLMFICVRIGGI